MNGRIFVLLAATGLFVHVWNANHRPQPEPTSSVEVVVRSQPVEHSEVAITLELQEPAEPPVIHRERHPVREVTSTTEKSNLKTEDLRFEQRFEAIVRSKAPPSVASLWIEPALLPDRLPPGIAIGLYQVVDNFGHSTLAQITPEKLAQAGIVAEETIRDLYVHQSGNQRWYFIRQGDVGESIPTVAPAAALPSTLTKVSPADPQIVKDNSSAGIPLLKTIMRNRVVSLQREQIPEQIAKKTDEPQASGMADISGTARVPGATGLMNKAEQAMREMGDLILQRLPSSGFLSLGIEWSSPRQDVQELPSVSVPGTEVELPEIPLRTVRQSNPEVVPPL